MFENFALLPESASTVASRVDAIFWTLVGISVFFAGLIALGLVVLSLRYRRRRSPLARQVEGSLSLEVFWSAIPLAIALFLFGWGAKVYFEIVTPPREGMEFLVTGKQWMWKVQHPTGHREINSLHVPAGETIILEMTSEDVIHDFYVPAFRVKQDVVPGMYTTLWFRPTKPGRYHLFCAEYCGTKHSEMIGEVVVMDPAAYEAWLGGQEGVVDPQEAGMVLFENLRCVTCHAAGAEQRGPVLAGRFGEEVPLEDGGTALFDEAYVRESILFPGRSVSAGYKPVMPTYQGQVTEGQIQQLIAYIESLPGETAAEGEEPTGAESEGEGNGR